MFLIPVGRVFGVHPTSQNRDTGHPGRIAAQEMLGGKRKPTRRLRAAAWVWVFPKLEASLSLGVDREVREQDSDRRGRCHVATAATDKTTRSVGTMNLHTSLTIPRHGFGVKQHAAENP